MPIYRSLPNIYLFFFLSFGIAEALALRGGSFDVPKRRIAREWGFGSGSSRAVHKPAKREVGLPTLCKDITAIWYNFSSNASPTETDCRDLGSEFMNTSPAVYIFKCDEIKELRQKGSCAFNVQLTSKSDPAKDEYAWGDASSDYATIAAGDITAFITAFIKDSIEKYKIPNGKLGSAGMVECMVFPHLTTTGPQFFNVTWGLYSS